MRPYKKALLCTDRILRRSVNYRAADDRVEFTCAWTLGGTGMCQARQVPGSWASGPDWIVCCRVGAAGLVMETDNIPIQLTREERSPDIGSINTPKIGQSEQV